MPGPVIDIDVDDNGGGRPKTRHRFGCGGLIGGLLLALFGARTVATTVIDYQWWKELGQLETWWTQLYVHTAPLFYVTAFGYLVLWMVHARAVKAGAGVAPILLLDEVAAHLDRARRKSLLEALSALGSQSWMTGTDAQLFEAIGDRGQIFHVEEGQVREVMED